MTKHKIEQVFLGADHIRICNGALVLNAGIDFISNLTLSLHFHYFFTSTARVRLEEVINANPVIRGFRSLV